MSDTPNENKRSFLPHGSITPPGPIGRMARVLFGLGTAYIVFQVSAISDPRAVSDPFALAYVAFAVYLIGYVVNIGFGLRLGQIPRLSAIAALPIAGVLGWQSENTIESQWLWQAMRWLMLYVYSHLGLSFLLSALAATPGCEMRAIPTLIGKLTGRQVSEHHCPGPIRVIDHWEMRDRQSG